MPLSRCRGVGKNLRGRQGRIVLSRLVLAREARNVTNLLPMPARRRHRTIMSFTPAGVTGTNAIARRLVFPPATPNISAIRRPYRWPILAEVFYGTQTHTHTSV